MSESSRNGQLIPHASSLIPAARLAALFLFLAALTWGLSLWRTRTISQSFAERSARHVADDVARVRSQMAQLESELDASAARIAARVTPNRARLFELLALETRSRGRGARILDAGGDPVAWWGEDYRAPGERPYQFDVTNLYVTRSRKAGAYTVQFFERIENVLGRAVKLHHRDAWVLATHFHGGFPRQEKGTSRHLIARRGESALWMDVTLRPKEEVVAAVRAEGLSAAAILIALGALAWRRQRA